MDIRILAVDDSATVVEALTNILTLQGYGVESCSDGESGWNRLVAGAERRDPMPDLLLLDLNIPGIDGLTLLRRMRADERFALLPVVILTVEADADTRLMALEGGANDYLPKPVQTFELLARVKTLTGWKLAERVQQRRLEQLIEAGRILLSTLDLDSVLHRVMEIAMIEMDVEDTAIWLRESEGSLECRAAFGSAADRLVGMRMKPGQGIAGWALEQRQPVLVDDVRTDPRSLERIYQYIGAKSRGLMAVPLLAREHDIGVIEVSSSEPGAYTNSELRTLQAVGSTLSMALENAGLYDELKTLLHEREQAQAQLIHAEKMTALGRLTASIAHEINNPLQAMQTYLALAQEEFDSDQRPEKVDRYLSTVGDEIDRIAAIVHRMRDFYRPAREELQPIYPHAVLESVLELTSKQLQHSNVTVERAWADYLPEIQANPDHLKQVFLNLVLNGIDAMMAGGTLYISTAVDQIQLGNDPKSLSAVRIEFSDTGEGIPPEVLPHIFEPFFTTKERGSGLGLSISYGIIQAHNGQITVESHIGLGTTFTILLPVEQPFNSYIRSDDASNS